MTTIPTQQGPVVGRHPELVAAAAALVDALPEPRSAHVDDLVAAVSWCWSKVSLDA